MRISEILRRLDAYPRTLEDFSLHTLSGAVVTVISSCIILLLIILEFVAYMHPRLAEELFVDTTRSHKLCINLDITVHNIACNISLDAVDSSGDSHLRIDHDIFKHRLDLQGNPLKETDPIKEVIVTSPTNKNSTCGSCYGAEQNSSQCCNTCEEVLDSYRMRKWNLPLDKIDQCKDKYKRTDEETFNEGCRVQGHLEVNRFPTVYVKIGEDEPIYTNQFSVTRHIKDLTNKEHGMPGIFFNYELSPLMVKYQEKYSTFGHFATNCCSIIGGVFTVAGIIAVLLQNSWAVIQRKLGTGKLS